MNYSLFSASFVHDPHSNWSCANKSTATDELGRYQTKYLQAALFASVLEDTILQFRVNMNVNNEWRVAQSLAEFNQLLSIKYGVEQPLVTDELVDVNPRQLDCERFKLNKLFADRFYLRDVLEATYVDLCIKRSYSVLADYVKTLKQTAWHQALVLQEEARNRQQRRDLARQIRQLRNHVKSATYDANCTISDLKTKVEDATLNAEIRGRYVTNWQVARSEQHTQLIHDKESKTAVKIELYKHRHDQEMRVHSEIELATNIMLNETLQDIEKWMSKYDRDIEHVDLKIQIMKNNHVTEKEKREELEKTIQEHDGLMKNWQQFKIDRENARLYREKMHNAAITVQAWWRGFLVRNQLGPYKPQPKRKGAAKDDKKKKK